MTQISNSYFILFKKLFFFIVLSQFIHLPSKAQEGKYQNLVFEGAGIRGIAYAGVLEELETRNILNHIRRVGGTSAGAITALAVSLGYRSNEIRDIIYHTNFESFNDGGFSFIGGFIRMKNKFGCYKGNKFTSWLEKIISRKTGNKNITFKELHDQGYKDLYITATCLNQQKVIIFSYHNYPQMKVKDAVRISMSIPLYFKAVFIDSAGNIIHKTKNRNNLDIMIDGGLVANFPITMFDSSIIDSNNQPLRLPNNQTIGIRIDTENQIQLDKINGGLEPYPIQTFKQYLEASYVYILESLNRQTLTQADWSRTISVSSADISPILKKLSPQQKNRLIQNGRMAVRYYLKND